MKLYLNEPYFCSLHLRKRGVGLTGLQPTLQIMRNSDNKFLNITNSDFEDTPEDIDLNEIQSGVYNFKLEIKQYNRFPDSYTIFYNVEINGINYSNSEVIYFENKNRAKLV